jgi:hypothetical protein
LPSLKVFGNISGSFEFPKFWTQNTNAKVEDHKRNITATYTGLSLGWIFNSRGGHAYIGPAIALTTKTVYIKDENSSQTNFRLAPIYFSAPCGKTNLPKWNPCCTQGFSNEGETYTIAGNTYWMVRFSTVDLLVMVACFVT